MLRLKVQCPAKINLFLSVGPPDGRGYHPLRTIFQAVSLFDTLEISFGNSKLPRVMVTGAELPQDNTVAKALRLGREVFDLDVAQVRLEKRIPMQGGLGGGSSDAAGVLRALNHVRPVPHEELVSVAAAIGADVPFFLTGGRAKGGHYGDLVTPLPDIPETWFAVAKPAVGCATAEMFRQLDAAPREWRGWPVDDHAYNDFESVAPDECLNLIGLIGSLGAIDSGLSGSGSSVFGLFTSQQAAAGAAKALSLRAQAWCVRSLTRADSLRIEEVSD